MSDTTRQVGADLSTGTGASAFTRHVHIERTKATATYTRSGESAALAASVPSVGTDFETIGAVHFYVSSVEIEDLETGVASKLTVVAEGRYPEETGAITAIGPALYDVEFQELRKKLEDHPCCGKLKPAANNELPSFENWQEIDASNWIPATSIPTFWASIGAWSLETYLDFKYDGVEEFVMYLPVVTRTLTYLGRPEGLGANCGTQQAPPGAAYDYISRYRWLLGPDACVQKGDKYDRKTSWMGADMVHPKIYPDWS